MTIFECEYFNTLLSNDYKVNRCNLIENNENQPYYNQCLECLL